MIDLPATIYHVLIPGRCSSPVQVSLSTSGVKVRLRGQNERPSVGSAGQQEQSNSDREEHGA